MSIKLTYFDIRGRAEVPRLILAAADQKFEDERITCEEWAIRKPKAKFNVLPNLEYGGKTYGQSLAIAQFLSREFGFYGKDNLEALKVDEAVQVLGDVMKSFIAIKREQDEARKKEVTKKAKDSVPTHLKHLEGLAGDNGKTGHFVGSKLSLADFMLFDIWDFIQKLLPEAARENDYPELKKIMQGVASTPTLAHYLATRNKALFNA